MFDSKASSLRPTRSLLNPIGLQAQSVVLVTFIVLCVGRVHFILDSTCAGREFNSMVQRLQALGLWSQRLRNLCWIHPRASSPSIYMSACIYSEFLQSCGILNRSRLLFVNKSQSECQLTAHLQGEIPRPSPPPLSLSLETTHTINKSWITHWHNNY